MDQNEPVQELLPVFLKLENKPVLVVGAGMVALEKIEALIIAKADVTVISPHAIPEIEKLGKSKDLTLIQREVTKKDLNGFLMVYVAVGIKSVNEELREYATRERILLNVVDDPEYCDFYSSAVVRRGPWRIAVSTQGTFAGLAKIMHRTLGAIVPDESIEDWEQLVSFRKKLNRYLKTQPERTKYLRKVLRKIQKKVLLR